jgi:hypothetical protein
MPAAALMLINKTKFQISSGQMRRPAVLGVRERRSPTTTTTTDGQRGGRRHLGAANGNNMQIMT